MIILKSGIINKISTLSDKSLRITVDTPELEPSVMADIFSAYMHCKEGIQIDEINTPDEKSPSQKMKAIIYRLWEQTNQAKTFESFYRDTMEKLNNMLKDKLS